MPLRASITSSLRSFLDVNEIAGRARMERVHARACVRRALSGISFEASHQAVGEARDSRALASRRHRRNHQTSRIRSCGRRHTRTRRYGRANVSSCRRSEAARSLAWAPQSALSAAQNMRHSDAVSEIGWAKPESHPRSAASVTWQRRPRIDERAATHGRIASNGANPKALTGARRYTRPPPSPQQRAAHRRRAAMHGRRATEAGDERAGVKSSGLANRIERLNARGERRDQGRARSSMTGAATVVATAPLIRSRIEWREP
jgi:hypothetical protein